MKMAVLWDAALYSLVETDGRFRSAYCLRHPMLQHSVMIETYPFLILVFI
jgi:hypothetical protein